MEARAQPLLKRWWCSRLGYRFIGEAITMLSLYAVYKLVRYAVRDEAAEAFANAQRVIHFERAVRLFTEPGLQRLVLPHPGLVRALNQYYVGIHFPVTIVILAWLYARRPLAYRLTRRVLVATTAVGMGIHILYPLAPPRMLPNFGFVDTGHVFGPSAYGAGAAFNKVANQFAAMPSLHFGWAVIVTVAVLRYGRSRLRWLLVAHPLATTAAIVLTANHYWMDLIVAGALLTSVYAAIEVLGRLRTGGDPPMPGTVIDLRDRTAGAADSRLRDLEPRVG